MKNSEFPFTSLQLINRGYDAKHLFFTDFTVLFKVFFKFCINFKFDLFMEKVITVDFKLKIFLHLFLRLILWPNGSKSLNHWGIIKLSRKLLVRIVRRFLCWLRPVNIPTTKVYAVRSIPLIISNKVFPDKINIVGS